MSMFMSMFQKLGWALMALCLLIGGRARADDVGSFFVFDDLTFGNTTIDFENDGGGQAIAAPCLFSGAETLTDLYAPLGVHFSAGSGVDGGAVLNDCSAYQIKAHSGSNLLAFNRLATTASGGRATEPETIAFDQPVPNVSIFAAGGFAQDSFRLDAYDAHGHLVDSNSAASQDWTQLGVASPSGIARVVISRESAAQRARVFIPDVAGLPGGTVAIPVEIDNTGRNVAGASATVRFYDALTVSDAGQVATGSLLTGGLLVADTTMPGSVTAAATVSRGHDGPGELLVVTATVPATAMPGTYPLTLSNVTLSDPLGNPIPVDAANGTLTVTTQPSFTSSATVAPDTVAPGGPLAITATVTDTGPAFNDAIVDLEVYDAAGNRAAQWSWQHQDLATGQSLMFTVPWNGPAAEGDYSVQIGVFTSNWMQNPYWNNAAGKLTVKSAPAAATCGDMNADGSVNIADAILAVEIAVGLIPANNQQIAAGCGNPINVVFATWVLETAVGINVPLPHGP